MPLSSWQKITRIMPGFPFGDGFDGNYISSTAPTMTYRSCSGSSSSTTLTIGSNGFTNGDIVKIIQVRGTGAGQYEINRISSGGGSTTLTLEKALQYTYTDSGNSQAQVIKIPRYNIVTATSGTWTPTAWDGDVGGELIFASKIFTPTATISATGKGFIGKGIITNDYFGRGRTGENVTTAGGTQQNAAEYTGGGGGGGGTRETPGGGAGGGHATSGANGAGDGPGVGGGTSGNSDLSTMLFGGAGGSGGGGFNVNTGQGGASGGAISIFTQTLNTPTLIDAIGGVGGDGNAASFNSGDGGGGSGGSILICAQNVSLGTDKLSVIGGATGAGPGPNGGQGGKGRIAIYYGGSITGSISSSLYGSYEANIDTSFVAPAGSFIYNML